MRMFSGHSAGADTCDGRGAGMRPSVRAIAAPDVPSAGASARLRRVKTRGSASANAAIVVAIAACGNLEIGGVTGTLRV
jgi:hypothetical protein